MHEGKSICYYRKVNLLLTFIIRGFENGTRKKTKSLLRFEVAHKETSIDSNWNWPTSYIVDAPALLFPKHGWPKVNQRKEAEIRMKQDEIMSRLFAMHEFQANPMDVVDKDVPAGEEF